MPSSNSTPTPVPFPQPTDIDQVNPSPSPPDSHSNTHRRRTSTNPSVISNRARTASIKLMEANPPPGMWAAAGNTTSRAPSLSEIRRGSSGSDGWNEDTQRKRAGSRTSQEKNMASGATTPLDRGAEPFPVVAEEDMRERYSGEATHEALNNDAEDKSTATAVELRPSYSLTDKNDKGTAQEPMTSSSHYANGYVPPPKLPWTQSFAIGAKSFWKWFRTPSGFLITLYALNVVAWGGMLFLLLCNAAPAMCVPTCNDINSPRRKWIEYDSQILNALFCVTGFGLAPWRFRDLYWWAWWRLGSPALQPTGLRRLAAIHRSWFRLPGSQHLDPLADASSVDPFDHAVPIPQTCIPDPPPTGIRAPPTNPWKMTFVLWMNASNTFFQILLCFFMWHYNRFDRPSWATGLFVALGCIVAAAAGIMMWHEGKKIKKVEGVPHVPKEGDVLFHDVLRRSEDGGHNTVIKS